MPLLLVAAAAAAAAPSFNQALAPRNWSFPRDHGRHDGFKTEWWYFTGNLRDGAGRRFGYQLTFFRTAFAPTATTRPSDWRFNDLYLMHAAVSDPDGKRFVFKDRLERGRPGLAWASDRGLDVSLLNAFARQSEKAIALHAQEPGFSIDLTCAGGRGPFLEGPGGVNAKGREPGQASYYYSMTRLDTSGTLRLGDRTFTVTGRSWMDHEFSSNALSENQSGWDWMGLQLSEGTDLMIYRLRDKSGGTDYLSGTRVDADGVPHYLTASDIRLTPADAWQSPTSGAAYPQRWTLDVKGLEPLTVRSLMPGQELITSASTEVTYFEGAAEVLDSRDKPVGEGYLEMTGYAKPLPK